MPRIRSWPAVGRSKPIQALSSVDLPDPFGPTSAVMLPSSTTRSRSRSAQRRRPYRLPSPVVSSTAAIHASSLPGSVRAGSTGSVGRPPTRPAAVASRDARCGIPRTASGPRPATVATMDQLDERPGSPARSPPSRLALSLLVLLFGRTTRASALAPPTAGSIVAEVTPFGQAARDGVRPGMRVISLNGQQLIRLPSWTSTRSQDPPIPAAPRQTGLVGPAVPTPVTLSDDSSSGSLQAGSTRRISSSRGSSRLGRPTTSAALSVYYPGPGRSPRRAWP